MQMAAPAQGLTLQKLQCLEGHTDRVWSVAWSPSGKAIASCSGDKTVRIWAREAGPGTRWVCKVHLREELLVVVQLKLAVSHSAAARTKQSEAPASTQLQVAKLVKLWAACSSNLSRPGQDFLLCIQERFSFSGGLGRIASPNYPLL
jgi:WD40 repeat protein